MSARRKIQLLPEHLIDQIKAGEVIEKPSSLIKELIENSLDAGATKIDIHLIDNGLTLIQLEDNGQGMNFDDLPLAFCRHATSKIHSFDDLYHLNSFGFRGEALASIAAVSKLTCASTPKEDSKRGGRIIFEGGKLISHHDYQAGSHGTSFFIKDLFFNTPARLKFLKSATSERNALKKIITTFLISAPHVQITIKWDDKEKKIYPAQNNLADRLKSILKIDQGELVYSQQEYEGHAIQVYLSRTSSKSAAGKQHFLFANHRLFFDKSLHQLVTRSLDGLWQPGETGHYIVLLDIPKEQIDVNVHPHKTQVKFFKSSLVYSLVSATLKEIKEKHRAHKIKTPSLDLPMPTMHVESFSHTPYESSHTLRDYHSVLESQESSITQDFDFIRVSNNYALFKDESERYYALHLPKLVGYKLATEFKQNFPLKENLYTPLLISEPFKHPQGKIDLHLASLQQFGLEIDRLDTETLVLRSLPLFLEKLNARLIIGELCLYLEKMGTKTTTELVYHYLMQGPALGEYLSESYKKELVYWLRREILTLLEQNIVVLLDDHAFEHLLSK